MKFKVEMKKIEENLNKNVKLITMNSKICNYIILKKYLKFI